MGAPILQGVENWGQKVTGLSCYRLLLCTAQSYTQERKDPREEMGPNIAGLWGEHLELGVLEWEALGRLEAERNKKNNGDKLNSLGDRFSWKNAGGGMEAQRDCRERIYLEKGQSKRKGEVDDLGEREMGVGKGGKENEGVERS